jgi:predicted choloylglycine hydrolase
MLLKKGDYMLDEIHHKKIACLRIKQISTMGGSTMRRALALLLVVLVILPAVSASGEEPRREDVGDLIVLHLYGSYREMGRQQAELLGPDLRRVYDYQLEDYRHLVSKAGMGGFLLNSVYMPFYNGLAPINEDSGFHEEIAGMASVLGVPPRNIMRSILSLAAGSTVFAATRSATADGQALIGRNVDWDDGFGRRKPVVSVYHPNNGDLDYIFVGWPLVGLPTVGLNEAGLAISLNFFVSDPQVSLFFPSWPHRRALQKARTVDEAIRIITASKRRGISAFLVLADASGDIAMVECTPNKCAVFRPNGDWFAQANHARTPEMIPFDRYRHPDSFSRRAGMEKAVEKNLGKITPEIATEILRDRTGESFANASTVANLGVLNSAVVQPASRTLWHSTTMQPHAPFGSFVPFTLGSKTDQPSLAASEALVSGALNAESEEIHATRRVLELHRARKFQDARKAWDDLLAGKLSTLDTRRLALGSAMTRDALGDNEGAYAVLEQAMNSATPFDVRGVALVSRGILADRLGRREPAKQNYEEALKHFASRPDFTALAPSEEIAKRGLERSQAKKPLLISVYDTKVPQ